MLVLRNRVTGRISTERPCQGDEFRREICDKCHVDSCTDGYFMIVISFASQVDVLPPEIGLDDTWTGSRCRELRSSSYGM